MKNLSLYKIKNLLLWLFAFTLPISSSVALIIFLFMLIIWLFNLKENITILKQRKVLWILPLIGIIMFFSTLYSQDLYSSFFTWSGKSIYKIIFTHYILLPFSLVIFVTLFNKNELKTALKAFLLAMFISELMSYLVFFNIVNTPKLVSLHLLHHNTNINDPSPFMSRILYSLFLSYTVILVLHEILNNNRKLYKIFLFLFLVSATVNLFINGGRTGQITFVFGIFIYLSYYFKFKLKYILMTLVTLITVLATAYTYSPIFKLKFNAAKNNIIAIFNGKYNTSWGQRVAASKVALSYLTSTPSNFILGCGVGNTKVCYHHEANKLNKNIRDAAVKKNMIHLHNQYLNYWFASGILSLILFFIFIIILLKEKISISEKPLLYSLVVVLLISSTSDVILYMYTSGLFFFFMLASILAKEN